jgi:hypothetical protein
MVSQPGQHNWTVLKVSILRLEILSIFVPEAQGSINPRDIGR